MRQWCHELREGGSVVHNKERSGRPSVQTDDLIERVNAKVRKNHRFMVSDIHIEFLEVSKTTLFTFVTDIVGYCKLCARGCRKC